MDEGESRLREALRTGERLTPFVGAGLSSALTGGEPCATWRGLLGKGVDVCQKWVPEEPEKWAADMKRQLSRRDKHSLLSVADEVGRRLREPHEGREFKSWIDGTVGKLTPKDDAATQTIEAIRSLDNVVVTTNYDTLIEYPEPKWIPRTWNDEDFASAFRKSQVVLHLHGIAKKPESIILGSADYQKLGDDKRNNLLGSSLFLTHRFIFIGCGDGLNDPHLAPLLKQMIELVPTDGPEHFILVTNDERAKLQPDQPSPRITPVAYGAGYGELPTFLRGLADERETSVSANPETDTQHVTAKRRTGPLSVAATALDKLQRALERQGDLKEALRTVESCRAVPTDMDELWDPAEEVAEHERLAEMLKDPAANLDMRSKQALSEFKDAAADIWRLTEPTFVTQTSRLAQITEKVFELERVSKQLLVRVTHARDDLEERTGMCSDYEAPANSLLSAYASLDKTVKSITALREGLIRQQATQETITPSPQRPQERMRQPNSAPADRAPAAGEPPPDGPRRPRLAPVKGQAAAGPATSIGEGDEQKVTVPPEYANRNDVLAVQVKGNSLAGDGVLDRDFVTVIPELEPADREMVIVTYGGEPDAEAQVKWLRRPEGADPYLQGSDPKDVTELDVTELGVDGRLRFYKVIGVVRWDIKKLS